MAMTSPSEVPSNYYRLLADIKNINYHIRGTAFFLFMQSHYLHWLYGNIKYTHINCVDPIWLFRSSFEPEMKNLHKQICSCRLIPLHTFRICLLSYIGAGMIQYCFRKENPKIPVIVSIDNIRELFNRSILAKEEIGSTLKKIEPYFS